MQRKGIASRCVLRQRRKPRNHLRCADEIQPGSRQRRHVQRLADMASVLGSIRMLVEERAARDKIEQCGASQQRQRAAPNISSENSSMQIHVFTLYLSTFDVRKPRLVANRHPGKEMVFLTPQPFLPKLRLSKHMQAKSHRIRILALLLGVIFLGAQFHFCTDLTTTPSAAHICPVCSMAASVVASQSPSIAIVPVMNRLEVAPLVVLVSSALPRATSPRAPPAL
jgi:hypothetical protein